MVASLKNSSASNYGDIPLLRWVQPEDRGVPFALVRQPVGTLLNSSFEQLADTPGVGLRKLAMLIELLERVRESSCDGSTLAMNSNRHPTMTSKQKTSSLSKRSQWLKDVAAIRRAGLEDVPLGRLAPSLIAIPRSLWETPLSRFTALEYESLFSIPYFGPRRIESVISIVGDTAHIAGQARGSDPLDELVLTPQIQKAQCYLGSWIQSGKKLIYEAVVRELVGTLMEQLAVDNGRRAVVVACHLLNVPLEREYATNGIDVCGIEEMSRPRISQIKNDIYEIFKIRWPQRKDLLDAAIAKAIDLKVDSRIVSLFWGLRELLIGKATMLPFAGAWMSRTAVPPL